MEGRVTIAYLEVLKPQTLWNVQLQRVPHKDTKRGNKKLQEVLMYFSMSWEDGQWIINCA